MAQMPYPRLFRLVVVVTVFGIGHHVDHVIHGNQVGWPLIAEVTPFTYSLGFYPVVALGLYLHTRGRIGPGYWTVLLMVASSFVGLAHFGPLAVEPPEDILGPYASAVAGYVTLGWLISSLFILVTSTVYAARLWVRRQREP